MKKKIITLGTISCLFAIIGFTLASNKARIDKAALPVKEITTIPVKVQEVRLDSFNTSFSLHGFTLPEKEVKIASEVQGKLVNLFIKNGDLVSAGQVIATLDASAFGAQLGSIESAISKANTDISRYKRLVEMGGVTAMQLESLQQQRHSLMAERKQVLQQIAHMQIRAPFSGKIENVAVEKGSYVGFGTVLADLLDISSLKINVYLAEADVFRLEPALQVSIHSVVLDEPVKGRVKMVSDKADASGKFLAEIGLGNSGKEKLKAGMLVDVLFQDQSELRALSVPLSAITGSIKQASVFVVKQGRAEQRSIKTGIRTTDKVEVLEGLQAGEQVVTSGQLNLEHGSPISIIR